jgi:KaiC/GvpD/RAD55 family RecA-like ATPase
MPDLSAPQGGERVAPWDERSEIAILGLALRSGEVAVAVATRLSPEDFYRPAHKRIAAAITARVNAGSHVDPLLVETQLGDEGLKAIGGPQTITDLITAAGWSTSVDTYIRNIVDRRLRRQMLGVHTEAINVLLDGGDPDKQLAELNDLAAQAVEGDRHFERTLVDLNAPLPEVPTLNRYLYPGRLTQLQGEPESGKTWIAMLMIKERVEAGEDVIYLDEEGGLEIVTERLVALGADPDAVVEHLHYFPFESRRWDAADLAALDQLIADTPGCTLAVLDSLPDFLTAANMSEDSSTDVTRFVNSVCARFRAADIAQLLLDHLPKPPADSRGRRKQSRYSRGSGAKLAKADVTLLVEAEVPFTRTTSGVLHLWCTKDRRGRLDIPRIGNPPVALAVTVADGTVTITEAEPADDDTPGWDGPAECMAVLLDILTDAWPTEYSGTQLVAQVPINGHHFREKTIREAAERLALDGTINARSGPHKGRYYSATGPRPADDIGHCPEEDNAEMF